MARRPALAKGARQLADTAAIRLYVQLRWGNGFAWRMSAPAPGSAWEPP